ncbi:hypothetical protein ES703_54757 [subsurface metagenome]
MSLQSIRQELVGFAAANYADKVLFAIGLLAGEFLDWPSAIVESCAVFYVTTFALHYKSCSYPVKLIHTQPSIPDPIRLSERFIPGQASDLENDRSRFVIQQGYHGIGGLAVVIIAQTCPNAEHPFRQRILP